MDEESRCLALAIVCVFALIVLLFSVKITPAMDVGQTNDSAVSEWYRK